MFMTVFLAVSLITISRCFFIVNNFFKFFQKSFLIYFKQRRRRDLNPRAAINDLHPFQGCPFGQLGYFSKNKIRVRLRTLRARAVLQSNYSHLRELRILSGAFFRRKKDSQSESYFTWLLLSCLRAKK